MKNFSLVPCQFTQVTVENGDGVSEKIKGLGLGVNFNCSETEVVVVFPSVTGHGRVVEYLVENGFNVTGEPLDC